MTLNQEVIVPDSRYLVTVKFPFENIKINSVKIKRNGLDCAAFSYRLSKMIVATMEVEPYAKVCALIHIWFRNILKENSKIEIEVDYEPVKEEK